MEVTRFNEVRPYDAPKHHGMTAFRLQGLGTTQNEHFWCGLSIFLPGGGAERAASPTEKVYIVLEGELTIVTDDGVTMLARSDSCRIAPNEERVIENRSPEVAKILVISATVEPGTPS